MRIFVTGGTGFIGAPLVASLVEAGHAVRVLARAGEPVRQFEGVKYLAGDPRLPGGAWEALADCDAAINLAGEPIQGRWTAGKKNAIRDSRIETTRNLVSSIPEGRGFTLISTSAVGLYGDSGERECTEESPAGGDFLASVARGWEAEATRAESKGARVVLARFAVVLGPRGGALRPLERLTRSYLAGPIAGGRQWFSWVHREDLIAVQHFFLGNAVLRGAFNVCSPNPVRQRDFARALGKVLQKPAVTPAPGFAVRAVLGEAADMILFSQRMVPARLRKAGFRWKYEELESALRSIYPG